MIICDPVSALQAIDQNILLLATCLVAALGLGFVYSIIDIRMTIRQKFYAEPFMGASSFLS